MRLKRITKLKNNKSNGKLYYHETDSGPMVRSLIYSALFFFILAIIFKNIFIDPMAPILAGRNAIIMLALAPIVYFLKQGEGYAIEENCIYYNKYRFIKRKLLFKDIKCIIVVNASDEGRIRNTPYIIMMGGDPEKILHYCMNSERFHVLSKDEVKEKLGGEIGYYSVENFWKLFKKGAFSICDYGFEWNKKEMHKVFEGFPGDYYVASSVIDCYRKTYDEIVKVYGIDKKRIHIINDSTYGIYRW